MSALWEGEALPREGGQPTDHRTWPCGPRASGYAYSVTCPSLTVSPEHRVLGLSVNLAEEPSQFRNTQASGQSRRAGKKVIFQCRVPGLLGSDT